MVSQALRVKGCCHGNMHWAYSTHVHVSCGVCTHVCMCVCMCMYVCVCVCVLSNMSVGIVDATSHLMCAK